jgi:hypothetical protein
MTREAKSVTVTTKGIENIYFQIIHVINNIEENINVTVKVVVVKTFL